MSEKGTKIFVRVRPFTEDEINQQNQKQSVYLQSDKQLQVLNKISTISPQNFSLSLDDIFWSTNQSQFNQNTPCQQSYIFNTIGPQFIDKALEGYNVCAFAYGQTGSGKTYTMQGNDIHDQEELGLIPRIFQELFQKIQSKNSEYELKLQVLEIYNEIIQDLFMPVTLQSKKGLLLQQDKNQNFYVQNSRKITVKSYEEIIEQLQKAWNNRKIGMTKMNQKSSRSHCIIQLQIYHSPTQKISEMNLIDLAGSESLKKSGIEHINETIQINKSLFALGNVINALSQHSQNSTVRIPYRESVLTKLLKNSLGGNSLTYMICTISPSSNQMIETINTLKFAERAKQIQNKVTINYKNTDEMEDQKISIMQQQINHLKKDIQCYFDLFMDLDVNSNDLKYWIQVYQETMKQKTQQIQQLQKSGLGKQVENLKKVSKNQDYQKTDSEDSEQDIYQKQQKIETEDIQLIPKQNNFIIKSQNPNLNSNTQNQKNNNNNNNILIAEKNKYSQLEKQEILTVKRKIEKLRQEHEEIIQDRYELFNELNELEEEQKETGDKELEISAKKEDVKILLREESVIQNKIQQKIEELNSIKYYYKQAQDKIKFSQKQLLQEQLKFIQQQNKQLQMEKQQTLQIYNNQTDNNQNLQIEQNYNQDNKIIKNQYQKIEGETFTCDSCFSDFLVNKDLVKFECHKDNPKSEKICKECLEYFIKDLAGRQNLNYQQIYKKCIHSDCNQSIHYTHKLLLDILGSLAMECIEKRFLAQGKEYIICAGCQCPFKTRQLVLKNGEMKSASCPNEYCKILTCLKCKGVFTNKTCCYVGIDNKIILAIKSKQCAICPFPDCGAIISKTEGCDHLRCKCSRYLCFQCCAQWDPISAHGSQYHRVGCKHYIEHIGERFNQFLQDCTSCQAQSWVQDKETMCTQPVSLQQFYQILEQGQQMNQKWEDFIESLTKGAVIKKNTNKNNRTYQQFQAQRNNMIRNNLQRQNRNQNLFQNNIFTGNPGPQLIDREALNNRQNRPQVRVITQYIYIEKKKKPKEKKYVQPKARRRRKRQSPYKKKTVNLDYLNKLAYGKKKNEKNENINNQQKNIQPININNNQNQNNQISIVPTKNNFQRSLSNDDNKNCQQKSEEKENESSSSDIENDKNEEELIIKKIQVKVEQGCQTDDLEKFNINNINNNFKNTQNNSQNNKENNHCQCCNCLNQNNIEQKNNNQHNKSLIQEHQTIPEKQDSNKGNPQFVRNSKFKCQTINIKQYTKDKITQNSNIFKRSSSFEQKNKLQDVKYQTQNFKDNKQQFIIKNYKISSNIMNKGSQQNLPSDQLKQQQQIYNLQFNQKSQNLNQYLISQQNQQLSKKII